MKTKFFAAAQADQQLIPWSRDPHVAQAKLYANPGLQLLTVETNSPVDENWSAAEHLQLLPQLDLDEQFQAYAGSLYEAVATSVLDCDTSQEIYQTQPIPRHFGQSHSERSVFLVTYLAQIEHLDPKQTLTAALAALVHDWGHGAKHQPHSQASSKLLLQLYDPAGQIALTKRINQQLQELIRVPTGKTCCDEWHTKDTQFLIQLISEHSITDFKAYWQHRQAICPVAFNCNYATASVFHDAIALDRVRFGNQLDARLLVTDGALQMLHLSKQEFDLYRS